MFKEDLSIEHIWNKCISEAQKTFKWGVQLFLINILEMSPFFPYEMMTHHCRSFAYMK